MSNLAAFGLLCLGVVGVKVAIWTIALRAEEVRTVGKSKGGSKKGGGKGC